MSQDLAIYIKTLLEKTSKDNISTEVTKLVEILQQKLDKLNINIKFDSKLFDGLKSQINNTEEQIKHINNLLNETIKITGKDISKQSLVKVNGTDVKLITDINQGLGRTLKIVQELKKDGSTITTNTINSKEIDKAIDKVNQFKIKTEQAINGLRNKFGDGIFNSQRLTGTDAIIKQINKITQDTKGWVEGTKNWENELVKVENKLKSLDQQMSKNKLLTEQRNKASLFDTGYNNRIQDIKVRAVVDNRDINKLEQDFVKLNDKIKNALSKNDTKAFDRYSKEIVNLKQQYTDMIKLERQLSTQFDQNNAEYLRGMKLREAEQQKFIANQERIAKQLNTKTQNALGLGVKFNNLSPEQLAPLEKALNRYKTLISSMQQKNISGQVVSDKDLERLSKLENAIKRVYDMTRISSKDSRGFNFEQYPKMTNAVHGATNAQNYYNQSIMQGKKLLEANVQETEKYIKVSQRLRQGSEITNLTAYINKATGETHKFSESMKSLMTRTYDLGSAFKTAMEKFSIWMASGTILFQSWHFFKDGISYVNEYNKALTELSVVYMQTQDQVEKLGEKLHNLSIEMGVSTQEVAKGAVEFARQGLSEAESIKRMETAMKYAKISNLDFSTSARILTATVNSMGVSAERAADIFSYMGDATATGADEIGEAFMRMGGSIGSTDIEFEKAASWVAVISSKTRESAYTIGNSVKGLIARMQSLKENGFAEDDGTQVNQVSKSLATIGVQLLDTEGNFRNFGLVMDEVGEKWKSLNSRHKAYIATTLAGTHQQARFLNLMEGYQQSIELYNESLTQAGISNKKFDLVQQGTEAQLIKMKNTFEGVWLSTFSSQGIRNAITILTGVGNAINHVIETVGFLPPVIIASTLAIAAFNNNMRTTLILNGTQFIGLLKQQIALWMQNSNAIARNATGASLATVAFNGLKLSLAGLNTALLTTGRFFAGALIPIAIISAVTYAITKLGEVVWDLSHKTENAKEEFNKLKDEIKTLNTETTETNNLIKSYEELANKANKTTEEKEKLANITQRLSELYEGSATKYNLEGQAIEANIILIKQLLKVKEQEREDKKNDLKNTFYDIGEDTFDNLLKNRDKIKKANEELNNLLSLKNNRNDIGKNLLNVQEFILFGDTEDENISELRKNISKFTSESRKDFETLASQIQATYSEFDNFKNIDSATLNLFIRDVLNNVEDLNISNLREFMDYIGKTELPNVFADYNKGLEDYKKGSIEYDVLVKKQATSLALLEKVFKDLGITAPETLKKIKEDLLELPDINKSMDIFTDLDSAVKSLTDTYKKSSDEISEYQQLLSDVTEGNDINFESVKKLIEANPKLISAIKNENGQMTISVEALKKLIKERKLEHKTAIESQIEKTKIINKATLDRIKSYGIEIEQIHNLADAEAAVAEMGKKMASNVGKMTPEEEKQAAIDLSRSRAEIEKSKQEIEEYKKLSQELIDSIESPNFGVKENKQNKDATNEVTDATKKYKNAVDALNNTLNKLRNDREKMIVGSKEYLKSLEAENEKIREREKLLKNQIANQLTYASSTSNTYTPSSTGKAKGIVDIALDSLGTPYKWGGNDLKIGVDCSGLVQQAYKEEGVSVPRVTYDQYKQAPIKGLKQNELQKGDLVFFNNLEHVGIYMGNDKFIEAPHTGANVRTSTLSSRSDFYAGARYLPNESATININGVTNVPNNLSNLINQAVANNEEAKKLGITPALIAGLIDVETGGKFNADAYNNKSGASGLGQFLSSTWKEEGNGGDVFNAEDNINAIVKYLSKRVNWAGGDLKSGIKGYGEGTEEYYNLVNQRTQKYGLSPVSTSASTEALQDAQDKQDALMNDMIAEEQKLAEDREKNSLQWWEAHWIKYDADMTDIQNRREFTQAKSDALNPLSEDYRGNLQSQVDSMKEQQDKLHEAATKMEEAMESSIYKENAVAMQKLKEKREQLSTDWWSLEKQINDTSFDKVNSQLESFNNQISNTDNSIQQSENTLSQYTQYSQQYRDELAKQSVLLKQKEELTKKEITYIKLQLFNTDLLPTAIQELNNKLQEYNNTLLEVQKTEKDKVFEIITSKIAEFDESVSNLNSNLSIAEGNMNLHTKGSADYNKYLSQSVGINKQIIQVLQQKQKYIQQELKNTSDLIQRQNLLQQSLDVSKAILDVKNNLRSQQEQAAEEIIQIYKDVYEKQKDIALEAEDERHDKVIENYDIESNKYEENINNQIDAIEKQSNILDSQHDKMISALDDEINKYDEIYDAKLKLFDDQNNEQDYQSQLTDLQNEKKDIENSILTLKPDNSPEARLRVDELNNELIAKNKEINNLKLTHNREAIKDELNLQRDAYKKQIEAKKKLISDSYNLDKSNLENSKQAYNDDFNSYKSFMQMKKDSEDEYYESQKNIISDYYDEIINDERRWARVREDVISGNLSNIRNDFNNFGVYLNSHMEDIGTSITTNITDKMKQAIAEAKALGSEIENINNSNIGNQTGSTGYTTAQARQFWDSLDTGESYESAYQKAYKKAKNNGYTYFYMNDAEDANRLYYRTSDQKFLGTTDPITEVQYGNIGNSGNTGNTGDSGSGDNDTGNSDNDGHSKYYKYKSIIDNIITQKKKWQEADENDNESGKTSASAAAAQFYQQLRNAGQEELVNILTGLNYSGVVSWKNKNVYHDGGIVGNQSSSPSKIMDIVNKLFNVKPNESIVKMLKGELAIPQRNVLSNFIPNMQNLVNSIIPNNSPAVISSPTNTYNLNIKIDSMNGSKSDINNFATKIINGVKRLGG